MKLIRYGQVGQEKKGVVIDSKKYDTSAFGEDYDEKFLRPTVQTDWQRS